MPGVQFGKRNKRVFKFIFHKNFFLDINDFSHKKKKNCVEITLGIGWTFVLDICLTNCLDQKDVYQCYHAYF